MAAIFPFEPELYEGLDIKVRYVGHPLLDEFSESGERVGLRPFLNIPEGKKVVGLFPGSRRNELQYMLETLVETAKLVYSEQPDVHFLVPVAGGLSIEDIRTRFPRELPVAFVDSETANIYDVAYSSDAVLSVSGTVTLQVALVGTPMAILYKLSPLSYAIGKRLVKVDHIGLANIVADKRVAQEYIQDEATAQALADEILRILGDVDYARSIRDGLLSVKSRLGDPGCSGRVAEMLLELIAERDSGYSS